jgi:integrase
MADKITLTDVGIRGLAAPATGQKTVWDKGSPLGVRISQGGSKTFIVMLGPGTRHTIGRVGIVKLADAREEAKRIAAAKTLGMIQKESTVTFGEALPLFLEDNYRPPKKPRTKSEAKRCLEGHFLPALRKKQLSAVTDGDISTALAKLDHVPSEQLHAFRFVRTFLKWCTRPPRRYIKVSPLDGYEAPSEDVKRSRILTDLELAKIWHACSGQFGDMVRLLILWGTRNGETGRLSRLWRDGDVLTIPGTVTKNKRAHSIPLLPMAIDILDRQPKAGGYYFPGREPDSHFNDGSWGKNKLELEQASGVHDWQLRDIRRTFRSAMPKLKVSRDIAEILLNHVSGNKNELDEIYDRYDYIEEKREALAKWEAYLSTILTAHKRLAA